MRGRGCWYCSPDIGLAYNTGFASISASLPSNITRSGQSEMTLTFTEQNLHLLFHEWMLDCSGKCAIPGIFIRAEAGLAGLRNRRWAAARASCFRK